MDKKSVKNKNYNEYNKNPMSYFSDAINRSKIGDIGALTKGNWFIKLLTLIVLIVFLLYS